MHAISLRCAGGAVHRLTGWDGLELLARLLAYAPMHIYYTHKPTDPFPITTQIIVGDGCCFLWVGPASTSTTAPPLGSLCVATMTPYDALPVSSVLLRDAAEDDLAQSLAHRLAKRTGLQVLASCSLQPGDPKHLPLLAALERRALGVLSDSN